MSEYNDPFVFAVPRGARRRQLSQAVGHIAETFGVAGTLEHLRTEEQFALFQIRGA